MADPCHNPYVQLGRDRACISNPPDDPGPVVQWQNSTQPDGNTTIQLEPERCSCSLCSATRHNDPLVRRTMEHQNTSLQGNMIVPYSLGVEDAPEIVPIVRDLTGAAQFVAPRAPWSQENVGYANPHERVAPLQVQTITGFGQTDVRDVSVTEGLRQLAGHYVNNPGLLVNAVRLEQGPSSRVRVVIVLEVANIL